MDVEQRHRGKSVITTYDLKGQAHSVKFEEFVADVRALAGSLDVYKRQRKARPWHSFGLFLVRRGFPECGIYADRDRERIRESDSDTGSVCQ